MVGLYVKQVLCRIASYMYVCIEQVLCRIAGYIYICILVAVAIIVGVNAPMSPAKDLLNLHLICYKFTIASE
jgi:hypothetical protein